MTLEEISHACLAWFETADQRKYKQSGYRPLDPSRVRQLWKFSLTLRRDRLGDTIPTDPRGLVRYVLKNYPSVTLTPAGLKIAEEAGVLPGPHSGKGDGETPDAAGAEAHSENCGGRKPEFLERKAMVYAATESGITSPSRIADVISAFIDKLQEDFYDFESESKTNIRPPEVTKDGDPLSKYMIRRDLITLKRHGAAGLNRVLIKRFKEYLKEIEP